MLKPLLIVFFIFTSLKACGQFYLNLLSGLSKSYVTDESLNYYSYTSSALYYQISGSCFLKKSIIECAANLTPLHHLEPLNSNKLFYEYNYLESWGVSFSISYYHEGHPIWSNFHVEPGASAVSSYQSLGLHYKNGFYDNNEQNKNTYLISANAMYPLLRLLFIENKHKARLQIGKAIFAIIGRPEDIYLTNMGKEKLSRWKFCSLKEFNSFQIIANYTFSFTQNFAAQLHVDIENLKLNNAGYFLLEKRNTFLLGMVIKL